MVTMLDQAKHVEREEICRPKKEVMQQIQEQIQSLIETSAAKVVAKKVLVI